MALWAAMGIGALIGGLGAKQKGGNFLKGALQGAALGGITGGLGAKYGGGAGGPFGFGTKMLPNFLAYSGITMGSEMLGQGDANKRQMEQQRRWLDEEEERRIARLSRIAGYDVADAANFMTPNKYFAAEGGLASRPQYQFGGISSLEDDPANAVNIQELQMDPGTMGPGGLTEEFDYMDEASLNPEIQKLYRAFLVANQATEEEVPVEMFMQIMQQQGGQQGGQQGPMMAAHGGRVYADNGGSMEMASGPSGSDMSGWHEMFLDLQGSGEIPDGWDFNDFMENLDQLDISPMDFSARGGYKISHGGSVMGKDEYDEELNRPGYAPGGIADLDLRGGGASMGPGTGTSDDIPAMLSDGEFVVTANAVKNLGGGDRMEGARRMYSMMNQLDPQSQSPAEMSGVGYA